MSKPKENKKKESNHRQVENANILLKHEKSRPTTKKTHNELIGRK
jgi:hypothetical protein